MKDEDEGKTEVSLFGSGASVNLRKSLYLKTGVDIEEFSEESKHRISQVTPRRANPGTATEPRGSENMPTMPSRTALSKEETGQTVAEEGETVGVIALSEEKANEVFIREMQRLSALRTHNTYNRGTLANLWEIFFPISLRKTLQVPPHTKSE